MPGYYHGIQLPQKGHRGVVNIPPVLVGHIFAFIAGIVQIEHRRYSVHADTVNMIDIKEKHRAGNQETDHLGAAVIEDQRAPLRMIGLERIFMFIQACSVESRQAVLIPGKMGRDPVHDNADSLRVHDVHKIHEILRRTVTAGHGIEACHLISPGIVERILRHRHDLDVRKPHLHQVIGQFVSHVAEVCKTVFFAFAPRADMHLVYGHGIA